MRNLGRCSFCGDPIFRLKPRTGPDHLVDFDWRPWVIDDEVAPTTDQNDKPLTAAALRKWRIDRPYRLGLAIADLAKGTFEDATYKPGQKPRSDIMYKPHMCEEKERVLYGIHNRQGD